jgi:alpha-D-ribose 1-methylphosphonate 5-phosphate C-P lyase
MFYKFNTESLTFDKIKLNKIYFNAGIIFTLALFLAYGAGRLTKIYYLNPYEKEVLLVNMDHPPFNEDELIDLMEELNIKFPHIVLAQAYLESSYKGKRFNSPIFRHNHNLFGMREAKQRITTALGTKRKHAYYRDWTKSVYDYGYYQASYLGEIKTEEDYYRYLGHRYAEDPNYLNKIKALSAKLKKKF